MTYLPQFPTPRDAARQKEADAQMAGAIGGIMEYRRAQSRPPMPSMDPTALQPIPSSLPTVPGGMGASPMGAPPMGMAPPAPPMGVPPAPPMGGAPMGGAPMGAAPQLPPGLSLPPLGAPGGMSAGAPPMLAAGGTPSGPFPPEAMQGDPMFQNLPPGNEPEMNTGSDPAAWGVITADKLVPLLQMFLQQGGAGDVGLPNGEEMNGDMRVAKPPPGDFMRWLQGGQSGDPMGQSFIEAYQMDPTPETAAELFADMQEMAREDPESIPRELIGVPGLRIRADLPSPTEAKERALSRIAA